jgi:ABC-2 type transport system ATP-binding protein
VSAIVVDDVHKRFRLYDERNQSLKAAIMRRRRARYREFIALAGVSLDVPEGTTVGLIGHNGSGKSTLLKCIARILRPDAGRIDVRGKVSALLELGAGFHPELSGRENVYLNGAILGLSGKELDESFEDIVAFAGPTVEEFIDAPVKNYSSGMYVRLGFAVAINVNPDVLLVDEVLAVGDEGFQQKCNEKFAELRARGKTIVVVSHALGNVRSLCDTVVWLDHGTIKMMGPSADIVDAYISESHEGRVGESGIGHRWGSAEAVIDRVELIGSEGYPVAKVRTGEDVIVRLHVRSDTSVAKPVFTVAFQTLEGFVISSPTSREAGVVPDELNGSAVVDLHIGALRLLPGTYDISASVRDYGMTHVFDSHDRSLRFDVDPGEPHESFGGIVTLSGQWDVNTSDE